MLNELNNLEIDQNPKTVKILPKFIIKSFKNLEIFILFNKKSNIFSSSMNFVLY